MAQSRQVTVTGVATATPATASNFSCTLQALLPLDVCAVYQASKGTELSIDSTDLAPFSVPFEGITKGRFFGIRLRSGNSMKVLVTTALGVAPLPLSDLFLWHAPNDGDQATAIQIVGTGDVAYLFAGDVS